MSYTHLQLHPATEPTDLDRIDDHGSEFRHFLQSHDDREAIGTVEDSGVDGQVSVTFFSELGVHVSTRPGVTGHPWLDQGQHSAGFLLNGSHCFGAAVINQYPTNIISSLTIWPELNHINLQVFVVELVLNGSQGIDEAVGEGGDLLVVEPGAVGDLLPDSDRSVDVHQQGDGSHAHFRAFGDIVGQRSQNGVNLPVPTIN